MTGYTEDAIFALSILYRQHAAVDDYVPSWESARRFVEAIQQYPDSLVALLEPAEILAIMERAGCIEEGVEVPYGVEWRKNAPNEEEWQRATAGMERVYRRVS